jgi:hypothetical protein
LKPSIFQDAHLLSYFTVSLTSLLFRPVFLAHFQAMRHETLEELDDKPLTEALHACQKLAEASVGWDGDPMGMNSYPNWMG